MLLYIDKSICRSKFQSKAITHHLINIPNNQYTKNINDVLNTKTFDSILLYLTAYFVFIIPITCMKIIINNII